MIKNNNGAKSLDFSPEITVSEENIKEDVIIEKIIEKEVISKNRSIKTSVNFDKDTSMRLQLLKEQGINVSNYVNKVVGDSIRLENELMGNIYGKKANDFTKFEILLHKDVAILFELLKVNCGAIPLANKLAEVIANDEHVQGQLLNGDCSVYGQKTLENALETIRRGIKRIQDNV